MELKDLVGVHNLDAVDFGTIPPERRRDSAANVMHFRLDGVVYLVSEDPDDGYRSSMREIKAEPEGTYMNNVFLPQTVVGVYKERRRAFEHSYANDIACDILELRDVETGLIVIEVGTDNTDDYYPCFVASFNPENMAVDQKVRVRMKYELETKKNKGDW